MKGHDMSIEHVTIDDLKTLAENLRAEGQNSRAQMVENVIKQMTGVQKKIDNFDIFRAAFDAWMSNPSENNEEVMKIVCLSVTEEFAEA